MVDCSSEVSGIGSGCIVLSGEVSGVSSDYLVAAGSGRRSVLGDSLISKTSSGGFS